MGINVWKIEKRKPSILEINNYDGLITICNHCKKDIDKGSMMFHGIEDSDYHLHEKCGKTIDTKLRDKN